MANSRGLVLHLLTCRDLAELLVVESVAIRAQLTGELSPLHLHGVERYTGFVPSKTVKQLGESIRSFVDQGRAFTPSMITIVIREYIRESDWVDEKQKDLLK